MKLNVLTGPGPQVKHSASKPSEPFNIILIHGIPACRMCRDVLWQDCSPLGRFDCQKFYLILLKHLILNQTSYFEPWKKYLLLKFKTIWKQNGQFHYRKCFPFYFRK